MRVERPLLRPAELGQVWFVHPNDLVGGWCVMNRDYPPSQLDQVRDPGGRVVAEVGSEPVAVYLATMHNTGLAQQIAHRDAGLPDPSGNSGLPAGMDGVDSRADTVPIPRMDTHRDR